MQNFKDVCGGKSSVWFEIKPSESKRFLKWAKDLGCVWVNGQKINPNKNAKFLHFSIDNKGNLANVPIFAWVCKKAKFKDIERRIFSEYL